MAINNNLIPTIVTDKNGKITTVHKRGEVTGNAKQLPPPGTGAVSPAGDRVEALRAISKRLPSKLSESGAASHATIKSYPTDLIIDIARLEAPQYYSVGRLIENGATSDEVSQYLHFADDVSRASTTKASFMVASLQEYDQLPPSPDYSGEEDYVRAQCSALLQVASAIDKVQGGFLPPESVQEVMIKDEQLVDLVIANPEYAEQIADFILERKTADFDLIDAMVSGKHTLHPGVL